MHAYTNAIASSYATRALRVLGKRFHLVTGLILRSDTARFALHLHTSRRGRVIPCTPLRSPARFGGAITIDSHGLGSSGCGTLAALGGRPRVPASGAEHR